MTEWNFFAIIDGKGENDRVGGNVKKWCLAEGTSAKRGGR